MSVYAVDSALWNVYTSDVNAQLLRNDPEAFVGRFDLSPLEREAIVREDFGALLDLGAHPFLMYKFALRLEGQFSLEFFERYMNSLRGHELRDIVT